MTQTLTLAADGSFSATTLTTQLTTMHGTNPIVLLECDGINVPEKAATAWAQTNGVPYVVYGYYLDAAGYTAWNKGVAILNLTNPQSALQCGTGCRATGFGAAAALRSGVTLTRI